MNEISKIKLPNNVTYELRDQEAARIYIQSTQPAASNGSFWGWTPPLPEKGQVITMNLDGSNKQYRVLKVNGTVAEVLAQFQYGSTLMFHGSSNAYAGSNLDTYMNTTYYNTLSTEAKNAIVDKNLIQYEYTSNSSVLTTTHQSYADYSTKAQKAMVGDRHCYAIGVEDIEEYFNGVFNTEQLFAMFGMTSSNYVWLSSAIAGSSNGAWSVRGSGGYVYSRNVGNNYGARPAFQIDLSKVSWS